MGGAWEQAALPLLALRSALAQSDSGDGTAG